MNEKIILSYLGDPNEKQSADEKPHAQAELFKKLKRVEKLNKFYNDFLEAYNNIVSCDIYDNLPQNSQMFIDLANSIQNNELNCCPYAFKNTIYLCTKGHDWFNPIVFDINNVTKDVNEDKHNKALKKLYNSFYNYLEPIGYNDINFKYLKYIMFFGSKASKYPVFNNLLWRFPNIGYFMNNQKWAYIPSYNEQIRYFLLKNKPYVSSHDDILKLDIDFYCKFLEINIPEKYISDLKNMINIMSKVISIHCCEQPQPDTTIYYCIHEFSSDMNLSPVIRHMHKLEFSNKSVRLADYEDLQQSGLIQTFKSINISENGCLHEVVNNYYPRFLYSVLLSIANHASDFNQINNISKALAMTFIAKVSKRPIVVVSCNDNNILQAKKFFNQLICSCGCDYSFVVDMGYTLKYVTHKNFEQNVFKMDNTKVKAFFIDNFEAKISDNIKDKISSISSNVKNIQFFIFQTSRSVDYIPTDNLIHINLSDWDCSDKSFSIDIYDALWGKLYLPIYGLHLIFEERRSKTKFLLAENQTEETKEDDIFLGMSKDEIIKKISEDFISRCFVSKEEAIERKRKRKKDINMIRAKNPNCTDEYIIEQLGEQPLFSTFGDKFLKYADVYLNTQYSKSILIKYSITSKNISKYIKNEYKRIFPYSSRNIEYTGYGKDRPQGFQFLSIKKPWKEMEKELQESNVNKVIGNNEKIEERLLNLIEVLPKTIDLKPLSRFADTNIHCHIETD